MGISFDAAARMAATRVAAVMGPLMVISQVSSRTLPSRPAR